MPLTLKQTTTKKNLTQVLYPSNARKDKYPQHPPTLQLFSISPNPPSNLPILFKNYHRFSRKETFLACWTYYSVYLKKASKKISESSRNHCTHESVLNRTMQNKTARQHPKNRCVNKLMTKIEKKEPFPAGSKTWPPTPMSNLFNLRAGNKLRLKAKINWLG